jgi:hypothetical protein
MADPVYSEGPWSIDRTGIVDVDGDNIFVVGSDSTCWWKASDDAHLMSAAPELLEVVKALIEETIDYATLNKLGDPEKQHNIKWARKVIAKAEGRDV